MAATFNSQVAADQARNAYRNVTAQLGLLALDTAIPEALGAVAEKTVGQTREAYDRSKDALEASIATFERSFDVAGWGAAAFNRKIIDIARRNLNSSFDLATSLAGAREPRRDRGIAGGLLAQAVQRIDGSSRGSPRAFDQGGGRCGRAAQGAGETQRG